MKKNILIVTYSYPPLNVPAAQRPYALAKYLDSNTFNVSVITCANPITNFGNDHDFNSYLSHVNVIKIKTFFGKKLKSNSDENISRSIKSNDTNLGLIAKLKRIIFKILQFFIFPDLSIFWYPRVKKFLIDNNDLIDKTDIVVSLSPKIGNHRIANYIKKINPRVIWLADFSDFHYVNNWQLKRGIRSYLHKKFEQVIIENATFLNFVTNTMYSAYKSFYVNYADKMFSSYNGFDPIDFQQNTKLIENEKLVIFYAGTFYNGVRSPQPLLELLDNAMNKNLLNQNDFVIEIAGNIEVQVVDMMKQYKSFESINFLGRLSRKETIKKMTNSTFLWLIIGNVKFHYQTVPIKLFEYIAARRPILNFAPSISESSTIIENNNIGYNFDTFNFDKEISLKIFNEIILNYQKGEYKNALPINTVTYFTWEKQVNRLKEFLLEN